MRYTLFILILVLISCSGTSTRRDLDYSEEFENGKIALGKKKYIKAQDHFNTCLLYTSPSPRDGLLSRMPSSA